MGYGVGARLCGRDARAPLSRASVNRRDSANSARLWTMRARWNGASPKAALLLSMGPTPFSVGDTVVYFDIPITGWKLQWGQRHSALETHPAPGVSPHILPASMGPTPFSVGDEGQRRGVHGAGLHTSMGPTPFSIGDCTNNRPHDWALRSSMGPTLFSVGDDDGNRLRLHAGRATSMGPTTFGVGDLVCGRHHVRDSGASMGPTPFSVGDAW